MTGGRESGQLPVSAVIFDFDGTLVQTGDAAWQVFRKVNERFDLGVTTPEQFFELFRDNVFHAIDELCKDNERARAVKREFLEQLRSDYLPPMVPGMADVTRALSAELPLCVVSSNAMDVVRRILVGNGIAYCFGHVFTADVEPSKSLAIQRFLSTAEYRRCRRGVATYDHDHTAKRATARETIMVTDTVGDVREATAAGVRALGVSWGMHTEQALLDAGAEFVAIWPQEIVTHVLGGPIADRTETPPRRASTAASAAQSASGRSAGGRRARGPRGTRSGTSKRELAIGTAERRAERAEPTAACAEDEGDRSTMIASSDGAHSSHAPIATTITPREVNRGEEDGNSRGEEDGNSRG